MAARQRPWVADFRVARPAFRRALLVVLAGAVPLVGWSTEPARWQTVDNADCAVWNPLPDPGDSVTWDGPCVDGKADGVGTEVFRYVEQGERREERYTGTMRAGKLNGQGTLQLANGDEFTGEFADGGRVRGTYRHGNGDRYTGDYRDDLPNGHGTYVYANGSSYTGDFVNGSFDGNGISTDTNGSRFVGEFRRGLPNGTGTLYLEGGGTFQGRWVDGCLQSSDRVAAVGVPGIRCGAR